ncbi:MAG: methionine--tRNA ligase, partial [Actinobacteria bacterium]|nr:methionine--tRNA ligase [Actinomycetota bacterium]
LPRSSQRVYEMLGGTGEWSGVPRIEEVDEDGGPSYPVITGEYRTAARWESAPITPGTKLTSPTPLFAKLAPEVVEDELARLEAR